MLVLLPVLLSIAAHAKTYRYSVNYAAATQGQTVSVGVAAPAPPGTTELTDWTCSAPDTKVSIVATKVSADATYTGPVQRRERRACTVTLDGKSDRYVLVVHFREVRREAPTTTAAETAQPDDAPKARKDLLVEVRDRDKVMVKGQVALPNNGAGTFESSKLVFNHQRGVFGAGINCSETHA